MPRPVDGGREETDLPGTILQPPSGVAELPGGEILVDHHARPAGFACRGETDTVGQVFDDYAEIGKVVERGELTAAATVKENVDLRAGGAEENQDRAPTGEIRPGWPYR